jgi:hypothetical protein
LNPDILLGIQIAVEVFIMIDQLLQFRGELLTDYRLVQQLLRRRLGLLLTAPSHDGK